MLIQIPAVFDADKLENIRDMLSKTGFTDGKKTAGEYSRHAKKS